MFAAQAHSFVQQARLAITLAWVAGYTNILTILTCGHVTSHVSGTTSDLGRGLAEGRWTFAGFALFLLTAFFMGAAASGVMTEWARRRGWESMYVLPMAVQALLLTGFAIGVEWHGWRAGAAGAGATDGASVARGAALYLLTGLASLAMGLQNATITRISSGVVRTTHVTGVLTDLGTETVQFLWWLRDQRRSRRDATRPAGAHDEPDAPASLAARVRAHPTARRLALLASVLGSFALGAALGTLAYAALPRVLPEWGLERFAMFPPVVFLAWLVYVDAVSPIAEIEPSRLAGDATPELPPALGLYRLKRDDARVRRGRRARPEGRSGRRQHHRLPDLMLWADRLPRGQRVLILDLSDVVEIDDDASAQFRAVLERFRREGREMVLTGLTTAQWRALRRGAGIGLGSGSGGADAGASGGGLDAASVCPDVELAIARGLNLLASTGDPPHG